MTALNEKLFDSPLTELQQEVLSVISEYRDLYYPHRTLQNEDQLRVVSVSCQLGSFRLKVSLFVSLDASICKKIN